MKEKTDKGSHYQDLRRGRPIQECWARFLHQEAGVPEGPWGFEELQKFRDYLGPQGYQLIMVEPSKCLIVFKDSQYNRAPHCIGLVKHQGHFDGLTSNPALINWSYCCHLCGKGYNTQDSQQHNCEGQNCPACTRINKTCPNCATWIKPTLYCPDYTVMFYGQNCFSAVLDTVHVTNFVQSRYCRWRTDFFSLLCVVPSIFSDFCRLSIDLRLYFLEKFE